MLIPIYTWTKGVRNLDLRRRAFIKQPWAQGVILLTCVIIAMLLANLPFTRDIYHNVLETNVSIFFKSPDGSGIFFPRGMTVESFINDILMTVFFFSVGLEIRREMKVGELSSVKKALLPVIAAFGGVVILGADFLLHQSWHSSRFRLGNPYGYRHCLCSRHPFHSRRQGSGFIEGVSDRTGHCR